MTKEFETTLVARDIIIRQDGDESTTEEANAGHWFPIVRIKDTVFERAALSNFDLDIGSNLLPTIALSIDDYSKRFSENQFPETDDLITIRISNNFDTLHFPIKLDMVLLDAIGSGSSMSFSAISNIPKLYENNNKAFEGNTTDVLREIAKEVGLGYVSNFTNSADFGVWICKENYYDFIQYIEQRMFIAEDDTVKIFIDQYNNLNVISLKNAKLDKVKYELLTDPVTGKPFDEPQVVEFTNKTTNDSLSKKIPLQDWQPYTNYGAAYLQSIKTMSLTTKTDELHMSSSSENFVSVSNNALEGTAEEYYSDRISNEKSFKKVLTSKHHNSRLSKIMLQGTYIVVDLKYYVPDVFCFMHVPVEIWEAVKSQEVLSQDESITNDTLPTKLEGKGSTEYILNDVFTGDYCIVGTTYSFTKLKRGDMMQQNVTLLKLT